MARPDNPQRHWKAETDNDQIPKQPRFNPSKKPGWQLPTMNYTPLDLFKMYFTNSQLDTPVDNTNKDAKKQKDAGKKFKWVDIDN